MRLVKGADVYSANGDRLGDQYRIGRNHFIVPYNNVVICLQCVDRNRRFITLFYNSNPQREV